MKNVFILTNFSGYLRSYSPIIVVSEQLKMFKRAGYEPVLITAQGWEPPEGTIFRECRNVQLPQANVYGEPREFDETDLEQIDQLESSLNEMLPDGAIVITHDLIFLPDYVKHNVAARRVAEARPSIQWIHWIHSATSPNTLINERSMYGDKYRELLSSPFPNSVVAFPNSGDIPRVARNFNFETDHIFEVPHSTDPTDGMEPIVKRVYDEKDLGDMDVLMVLPVRLDRGKQVEMNVRVIAACKQIGLNAHLVVCDFQSTGDDKVVYREELKNLAHELDAEDNVTFLSEFDEAAFMESDHKVVLDFFTLSNVFMLASVSETYSLVAQEAMMKGNLVILNHHFSPMKSIYGDKALYRMFNANISAEGQDGMVEVNYSDIDQYMRDMAINIKYYLLNDKVLAGKTWVRRRRNPDAVFRDHLEPLLYRGIE